MDEITARGGVFESAGRVGVTVAAICAVAAAQAPQPFLPPHADPHHSLSTRVAMLDANRDGQEDVIAPGFVFGSLLVTIDEHGRQLASSPVDAGFVANPRAAVSPTPIAVAGVDLDGDSRKDYVFVTSDGGVHVQHNRGAERFAAVDFGPPQTLDQLGQMLPNAPPLSRITVAAIVSGDFDGDGTVDLAVGFGVHDLWNGLAKPGLIACYLADGVGGFTPHRVPVAGSVIDLEWADLDGDGSAEHFVAIVEQGGVGAWFHNLVHLRLHNQTLVATGPAISLGQTRHVALEIGDVDLDGLPDYVCAVLDTDGNAVDSSVVMYPGDGAGSPDLGMAAVMPLPPGAGIGSYVPSLQVEDFNGDGVLDVAALRGTVTTYASLSSPSEVGVAEVLVAMGPTPFLAVVETVPLDAKVWYGHTTSAYVHQRPLWPAPDMLFACDLGTDGNDDLMVAGARTLAQPNAVSRLTLRNASPPRLGYPARIKVGEPSSNPQARLPRIGFDGEPRIGNLSFAGTIQNIPPRCLSVLMWGPVGLENVGAMLGLDLHLVPQVFGAPVVTTGQGSHGFGTSPLPIPSNPALVGDTGCFQFCYYDPTIDAFGASQGTGLWIGG